MRSVCVFCASSDDLNDGYCELARELGLALRDKDLSLVYGGGNNGLMGILAETMHKAGSTGVVGVIPRRLLECGWGYDKVDEMVVADGMRERKAIMEERANAFIGLPGGVGTLEELLEIITLRQLGMLEKPIVILNAFGYFDGLLAQFERAYKDLFMDENCRRLYYVAGSVDEALDHIQSFWQ